MSSPDRLAEIKARAEKALPGPWRWGGYTDGSIELRTAHSGGMRVITTMHPEPCVGLSEEYGLVLLDSHCSNCGINDRNYRTEDSDVEYLPCLKPVNLATLWVGGVRKDWAGPCEPINRYAVREVSYRNDVALVKHPDAEFIVHSRQDIDWLISEVERLRVGLSHD